jgi:hypothetical protein
MRARGVAAAATAVTRAGCAGRAARQTRAPLVPRRAFFDLVRAATGNAPSSASEVFAKTKDV